MIPTGAASAAVASQAQNPRNSQNLAALVSSLMGGGSLGALQQNQPAYPIDEQTALGDLRLAQKQQMPGFGTIDGATWGNVVAALLQPLAGRRKEKKAREEMSKAQQAQAKAAERAAADEYAKKLGFANYEAALKDKNAEAQFKREQAANAGQGAALPREAQLFEYAQRIAAEQGPEAAQKFMEFYTGGKGPAVTVNTGNQGPQYGGIPQGWMVQDGQMVPVPGGPADREAQAQAEKEQGRDASNARKVDSVTEEIDYALGQLGAGTSGIGGALTRMIPGAPAVDFEATVNSVRGNLAFDQLQQMRENSPTGGALGAVSERELGLLESTVAGYDPNMSEDAKRRYLEKIKKHYNNWQMTTQGINPDEAEAKSGPTDNLSAYEQWKRDQGKQ